MERTRSARASLVRGEMYLAEGNYKRALEENRRVLAILDKGYAVEKALFNIAILYAHDDNPEKDYQNSRDYFGMLVRTFPDSTLAEEAGVWIGIFNAIDDIKREKSEKEEEIIILEEQKSALTLLLQSHKLLDSGKYVDALKNNLAAYELDSSSPAGEHALFNMGLIYAHHENPDKDFKKSAAYFEKMIEMYPQSPLRGQAEIWLGVLNIIERSKQVDIEIEKKKKELRR